MGNRCRDLLVEPPRLAAEAEFPTKDVKCAPDRKKIRLGVRTSVKISYDGHSEEVRKMEA